MVVAFGFSIGDFIAGINTFKDICVAMRDHGGAVEECQEISGELKRLQNILDSVRNMFGDAAMTSNDEVDRLLSTLMKESEQTHELISRFTERLKRYDPGTGAVAPQTSSTESSLTEEQKALRRAVKSDFMALSTKLDNNHAALNSENTAILGSLQGLADKIAVLESQQLELHNNLKDKIISASSDVSNYLSGLESQLNGLSQGSSRIESQSITAPMAPQPPKAVSNGQTGSSLSAQELHAILQERASSNSERLHWDSSVMDLMKLLGLHSGLFARDVMAQYLGVNRGPLGSAPQNIALQAALMNALADNGGDVPGGIYDLICLQPESLLEPTAEERRNTSTWGGHGNPTIREFVWEHAGLFGFAGGVCVFLFSLAAAFRRKE